MPSISIAKLKEKWGLLKDKSVYQTESLVDEIYLTYFKKQLILLESLLENDYVSELEQVKSLKSYLAKNWAFVKGAALCYTALPDDEFTFFLCEIAQFVKEYAPEEDQKEELFAINYLMPGVCFESMAEAKYPHIEANDATAIQGILKSHILGREGKYLIPVKQFAELARHKHGSGKWTNYYFDLYNNEHQASEAQLSVEEYNRLVNHSSASEALMNAVIDYDLSLQQGASLLASLNRLCQLLRLNSADGVGKEQMAAGGAYDAIIQFNDYYTRLTGFDLILIAPLHGVDIELSRISKEHGDAPILINRDGHISMYGLTAQGWQETTLADDVFWDQRNKCVVDFPADGITILKAHEVPPKIRKEISVKKAHSRNDVVIPKGVSGEIERLLNLASDQENNRDSLIETCIATLRKCLEHEMAKDELALAKIGLNEEAQKKLIGEKLKQIETCQDALTNGISDGFDKLNLTPNLLSILGIAFSISSQKDVKALVQLTPEEIKTFCQKEVVQKQFANQFDLEGLVLFIYETPLEKLGILFSLCGKAIIEKHIKTADDFLALLIALDSERIHVILENEFIREKLYLAISEAPSFKRLFEPLSLEQRTTLYDTIKIKLPELIHNGFYFKIVLQWFTSEQRTEVYQAIKAKLPEFICSVDDFAHSLSNLTLEQRTEVCEAMQDKLPQLIRDSHDLKRAMEWLRPGQCVVVCEAIKNKLPQILSNMKMLLTFVEGLTQERRNAICGYLSSVLNIHLLNVESDFPRMCQLFSTEGKKILQQRYFEYLLEDIKHHGNLDDPEFKTLCDKLAHAFENYFNGRGNYSDFKAQCDSAAQEAHLYLRNQQSLLGLVSKWFLVAGTLGTVVPLSMSYSRLTTGNWTCHFFEASGEASVNKLQSLSNMVSSPTL